jgi:hypothetical protein
MNYVAAVSGKLNSLGNSNTMLISMLSTPFPLMGSASSSDTSPFSSLSIRFSFHVFPCHRPILVEPPISLYLSPFFLYLPGQ